jgi:hypothetical protein
MKDFHGSYWEQARTRRHKGGIQKFRVPGYGRVCRDERDFVHVMGEEIAEFMTYTFGPPPYKYDYEGRVLHACGNYDVHHDPHMLSRDKQCCSVGRVLPLIINVGLSKLNYSISVEWASMASIPAPAYPYKPGIPRRQWPYVTTHIKQMTRDALMEWLKEHLTKIVNGQSGKIVNASLNAQPQSLIWPVKSDRMPR